MKPPVTLSGGMQVQQCLKWGCTVERDTKSLLEPGEEGIILIQSNLVLLVGKQTQGQWGQKGAELRADARLPCLPSFSTASLAPPLLSPQPCLKSILSPVTPLTPPRHPPTTHTLSTGLRPAPSAIQDPGPCPSLVEPGWECRALLGGIHPTRAPRC